MSLRTKLRFLLAALSVLIAPWAAAAVYYVSPTGSDTANGSAAAPFRTIGRAASVVAAGDSVLIAGGIYVESSITPAASGREGAYIVFKPQAGTGEVIVRHPATTVDTTPVFQLSSRGYIWIEGLSFRDFTQGQACISMSGATGNVVFNNRFENLGHGAVSDWNCNSMVWVYKSVRCVVANNYFRNVYGDGISLKGTLKNT